MSKEQTKGIFKKLSSVSISEIDSYVEKRKSSEIARLKQERVKIDEQLNSLDGTSTMTIKTKLSKKVARKVQKAMAKGRVINEKPLKDLLVAIASDGQSRTPVDFLNSLKNTGWKTSSEKPYNVVAAALATQEGKNVFRRVGKGLYQLVQA